MIKSYKFRLYPSKAQVDELNRHLWISKELWNSLLQKEKEYYGMEKSLHERMHHCPNCGLTLDRDTNASINILNRATVGNTESNASGNDAISVIHERGSPCL